MTLTIYGFETSNNMKVRVALGYKGIDYTFHSIDPKERSEILRLSGQHLTPLMVHDDRLLFDSAAILRYLDANFPDTPKLFGDSHPQQWEIEGWESFGRTTLAKPMMAVVHRRVKGEEPSDKQVAAWQIECADAITQLEQQLAGRTWLVGNVMTAADITTAAVVYRIREGKFFALPPAAQAIAGWVDRVMSFDRGPDNR